MKKLILPIVLFVTVPVMAMQDSGSSLQIDRVSNQKSNGITLPATPSSSRPSLAQSNSNNITISSALRSRPRSRASNSILRNSTYPIALKQNAKQKKIVDFDTLQNKEYLMNLAQKFDLRDELGDTWLMWAMYNNRSEIAREILQKGLYSINDCDADGDSILLIATRQKKGRIAWALIDNGADVNALSKDGASPLHWATYHNNTALSRKLIKKTALINAQEPDGNTALHWATYHNNMPTTKALLKRGAKLNLKGKLGNRPLMYAVKNGNEEMVRYLIKYKANVNLPNDDLETPLFWAVCEKQNQIAILLLNNNAWVNQRVKDGRTALTAACATANKQLIVELIKRGATPNNKDDAGNTPKSWVYESEDDEFKSWFKEILKSCQKTNRTRKPRSKTARARRSRDTTTESVDKSTIHIPLIHPKKVLLRSLAQREENATTSSSSISIAQSPTLPLGSSEVNSIQNSDRDKNTKTVSWANPLVQTSVYELDSSEINWAQNVEEGEITDLAFFADPFAQDLDIQEGDAQISSSADPFAQRSMRQSSSLETQASSLDKLYYDYDALVNRLTDLDLIKMLYTNNLDINRLLVAAVKSNRANLAKELIARNVNVNTQDEVGDTPLILAARNANIELIDVLLKAGASLHIINRFGVSAPLITLANNRQVFTGAPLDNPELLDVGQRFIDVLFSKSVQKPSPETITLSSRSSKAPRNVEQTIELINKKTYQSQTMMTIISREYDRLDSSGSE